MPHRRAQRQLNLIDEFETLCANSGIECWLRGGWALDFLLGRITRPHADIDLFIWAADAPRLLGALKQHGYEEFSGPPPEQQRNLTKAGEELHVTLLERNEFGVVTAGGRWADSPWPDGMLDGPVGRIGIVRCRVISARAQLWAKEEVPKALGQAQREHDAADIALLQEALSGAPARAAIRPFEAEDAEQAARLLDVLAPAGLETAKSLVWRQSSEPDRARRRSWVALEGENVIGFATAYFQWFGGESGKGRLWVGVRQDRRRRGIGSALWDNAVTHLRGARKHTVEVDDDPAGLAFVERRGFRQYEAEAISRLDPRTCRLAPKPHEGPGVVPLRDVLDRDQELFDFYGRRAEFRQAIRRTASRSRSGGASSSATRCLTTRPASSWSTRTGRLCRWRGSWSTMSADAPRTNGRRRCRTFAGAGLHCWRSSARSAGPLQTASPRSSPATTPRTDRCANSTAGSATASSSSAETSSGRLPGTIGDMVTGRRNGSGGG